MIYSILTSTYIGHGYLYHLLSSDKSYLLYFAPRKYKLGQVLTGDPQIHTVDHADNICSIVKGKLNPIAISFPYPITINLKTAIYGNDEIILKLQYHEGIIPRPHSLPFHWIPETKNLLSAGAYMDIILYATRRCSKGIWYYSDVTKVDVASMYPSSAFPPFLSKFINDGVY